jgi:hypothetical protein
MGKNIYCIVYVEYYVCKVSTCCPLLSTHNRKRLKVAFNTLTQNSLGIDVTALVLLSLSSLIFRTFTIPHNQKSQNAFLIFCECLDELDMVRAHSEVLL